MALVRGREVLAVGAWVGAGVAAVGVGAAGAVGVGFAAVGAGLAAGGCCGTPGKPGGNEKPGGSWMLEGRVVGICRPLGSGNGS